jgi:hypothetical protein
MPRISQSKPVTSVPIEPEKPFEPPKTKVLGEGTRTDDGNGTTNALVVQRVSVPFATKSKSKEKTEFKNYFRIFVRPDESHDEPDARFDEHEPEDEADLKRIFATYGKGSGTTISIRLNIDEAGKEEFFLDVRHPKPEVDDDAKLPMVLIDPKDSIGDIVADLFYETSGEDPPNGFTTRTTLEEEAEKYDPMEDERAAVESTLTEFDMPGDLPSHLYSLPERLRSIFRKAKGLDG